MLILLILRKKLTSARWGAWVAIWPDQENGVQGKSTSSSQDPRLTNCELYCQKTMKMHKMQRMHPLRSLHQDIPRLHFYCSLMVILLWCLPSESYEGETSNNRQSRANSANSYFGHNLHGDSASYSEQFHINSDEEVKAASEQLARAPTENFPERRRKQKPHRGGKCKKLIWIICQM